MKTYNVTKKEPKANKHIVAYIKEFLVKEESRMEDSESYAIHNNEFSMDDFKTSLLESIQDALCTEAELAFEEKETNDAITRVADDIVDRVINYPVESNDEHITIGR